MDSKILIIYNAILVDSSIENPGLVVVKNGKICGVFLGEVKNSEMAFVIREVLFCLTQKDLS